MNKRHHLIHLLITISLAVPVAGNVSLASASDPLPLYDPNRSNVVEFSDSDITIKINNGTELKSAKILGLGGLLNTIALPKVVRQVDSISRVSTNRAVVIGAASGTVGIVTVLDLTSYKVIDYFFAYGPRLSPDGSYIAFGRFYPPHGEGPFEDQHRIYSLLSSPSLNRSAHNDLADYRNNVGYSYYPDYSSSLLRSNTNDHADGNHRRAGGYYWSENSRSLFFADVLNGVLSVVRLHIDAGSFVPDVRMLTDSECAADCSLFAIKDVNELDGVFKVVLVNLSSPGQMINVRF